MIPVIRAVKSRFDVPVSLDTYKSVVAKAGLEAGTDLINDIWGLKYDPEMASVIAQAGVPCVLMHNHKGTDYRDFLKDVMGELGSPLPLPAGQGLPGTG